MRRVSVRAALCCAMAAAAVFALAQGRKPGLWETASTMTWQQSPFPAGLPAPPGGASPFGGGTHVSQVCVTQEMIDRYGAPMPQSRGDCRLSNVVKSSHSFSADMVCTGAMSGKARVEGQWTEDGHSTAKVHFTGAMQMGPHPAPVEWTIESSSEYKGPDCGSVRPMPMPKE